MSDSVLDRVRSVVAAVFGVPLASITEASGAASIEGWDSMTQLHLIVALEAELGISLEPEQAVELVTVGAIANAITTLQA